MKIYTKTGDKGKTSLFDGTRVSKSDIRIEAYGTLDECNSVLGHAIALLNNTKHKFVKEELTEIQHDIYGMTSTLALPQAIPVVGLEKRVTALENMIDALTANLPTLTQFITPGGGKAGSLLHVARTVARRAERRMIALAEKEPIDETMIKYVNRLSDLLFTMSRFVNNIDRQKEIHWRKR